MDILFVPSISVTNLHENMFTFYTTINDITHVTSINAVFIPHQVNIMLQSMKLHPLLHPHVDPDKMPINTRESIQIYASFESEWSGNIEYYIQLTCVEAVYNETSDEYPNKALYPWTVAMTSKT